MSSETLSFRVDFSKEEDFLPMKTPALHTTNKHRNSDPIYDSIQCSRFLMKRKTNSNKTRPKPRVTNDYGYLNNLNKLSLENNSVSSQLSSKTSLNSWHSASSTNFNQQATTPDVPSYSDVMDDPTQYGVFEETTTNNDASVYEEVPSSLPRQPLIPAPTPAKTEDDDFTKVKEAFDFLDDLC